MKNLVRCLILTLGLIITVTLAAGSSAHEISCTMPSIRFWSISTARNGEKEDAQIDAILDALEKKNGSAPISSTSCGTIRVLAKSASQN